LGLGDIEKFPFVEAPDRRAIRDGIALLQELGALAGPEAGDTAGTGAGPTTAGSTTAGSSSASSSNASSSSAGSSSAGSSSAGSGNADRQPPRDSVGRDSADGHEADSADGHEATDADGAEPAEPGPAPAGRASRRRGRGRE